MVSEPLITVSGLARIVSEPSRIVSGPARIVSGPARIVSGVYRVVSGTPRAVTEWTRSEYSFACFAGFQEISAFSTDSSSECPIREGPYNFLDV